MNQKSDQPGYTEDVKVVKCDDIQALLFDYMGRELGEGRSRLVREHVRKCENCQASGAQINATLELLQKASSDTAGIPEHLSDESRKRIIRAVTHPIIDWIDTHHVLVSVIAALLGLIVILWVAATVKIWREEKIEKGIPVRIGSHGEIVIRKSEESKE